MENIRARIKAIIMENEGLPGRTAEEYAVEMRKIVMRSLSKNDKLTIRKNGVEMDNLILDLSHEIANEVL